MLRNSILNVKRIFLAGFAEKLFKIVEIVVQLVSIQCGFKKYLSWR